MSMVRWTVLLSVMILSFRANAAPVAPLHVIKPFKRVVTGLAFSPDNKLLAASFDDNTLRLIDVAKGTELAKFGVSGARNTLRFTADGNRLLAITNGGVVSIDVQAQTVKHTFRSETPGGVTSIDISPDGKFLAAVGRSSLSLWNIETGVNVATVDAHSGNAVNGVAFSPDGEHLATVGNDKKLVTWSTTTVQQQKEFDLSSKGVCICYLRNGESLIIAEDNRKIFAVNASSGDEELLLSAGGSVLSMAVSPDSPVAILSGTGSFPGVLLIDKKRLSTEKFAGHKSIVQAVAVSRDGRFFASGDNDGAINVYATLDADR